MARKLISAMAASIAVLAPSAAGAHELPLGDGRVSSSPQAGQVYSCQQRFNPNAPGAQASGEWLDEARGTWDPDKKPTVDGNVRWPGAVNISLQGDSRVIRANGLPTTHGTGTFPVSRSDDAWRYDRNPNSIMSQDILLTLPAVPQVARTSSCVPMGMIGFTVTGTALFNALDARGDDAPAHEIQDSCNGHPERDGVYHFHNYSGCFDDTRSGPNGASDLIGYALDGFGIYGMYENGRKLTNADLDACHGRTSTVLWDGKPREIYHYVFTEEYPYTIGCFRGQVAQTAGRFMNDDRPPLRRTGMRPPRPRFN